jgi:predicted deacylase
MNRQDIKIRTLASGHDLTIPVFSFKGSDSNAPSVYLQASVHGDEVEGTWVIHDLLEYFKTNPPKGDVTLVPMANPFGTNHKIGEYTFGRYEPTSGDNFNRNYTDIEKELDIEVFAKENKDNLKVAFRTKQIEILKNKLDEISSSGGNYVTTLNTRLQMIASQHDLVIDLHTASRTCYHIYLPEYALEDAKYFHIHNMLLETRDFGGALEEACFIPWWKLSEVSDLPLTFQSFTLEVGDHERASSKQSKDTTKKVLNYLAHKKVIESEVQEPNGDYFSCSIDDYLSIYSKTGGIVDYLVEPGSKVVQGQDLAVILNAQTMEKTIVKSPVNCILINIMDSSIAHEGSELFRVLSLK